MSLIEFTHKGIFCPQANVYIDPSRSVRRALITHGHSDHARPGHGHYLCTPITEPILKHRLGKTIRTQVAPYGKTLSINGVKISFHPAGHIPGSAQIRLEYNGEIWVITGDYKIEADGLSDAYEVVQCHHFVTETTFALPIYRWEPQEKLKNDINAWWQSNNSDGKVSLIGAYSLGKAQRILHMLDTSIGPIYTHGAVELTNEALRKSGIQLPDTTYVSDKLLSKDYKGAMIVAPPSAIGSPWMKRFKNAETASVSGWMQVRGIKRRRSVDRGFVLSDHADWNGLLTAVKETGAEHVYATHGYTETFSRYLREQGIDARSIDGVHRSDSEDEI